MESFFKLRENNTDVSTEVLAGITTFFAMSYIIFVNPAILSQTGIPWGAVFLATIIATVVSTLVMGALRPCAGHGTQRLFHLYCRLRFGL